MQSSTQHSVALALRLTVECLTTQSSCLSSPHFVFRKILEPPLEAERCRQSVENNTRENVVDTRRIFMTILTVLLTDSVLIR